MTHRNESGACAEKAHCASNKPEAPNKSLRHRKPGLDSSGQIPDTLTNIDFLPPSACVRLPTVEGFLGVSTATVWRMVKAGKLNPRKLSARVTVFNVGELRSLVA